MNTIQYLSLAYIVIYELTANIDTIFVDDDIYIIAVSFNTLQQIRIYNYLSPKFTQSQ